MAKFIPVIGEAYTAVESAICAGAAGMALICGEEKSAKELWDAAGNAWVEYAEGNLIATPIYGLISEANGNYAKSRELSGKFANAAGNAADGIPVVGHVKGIVHYAMGDTEKGNRSMEASTRSAAVLGAGILTGGLGGAVVVGAVAGVGTGIAYDGIATGTDYAINGNKGNLHGSIKLIQADTMTPNELTQSLMGFAGDGLSGAGGAKLGRNIRGHLSKSPAQKNLVQAYEDAGVKDTRQAASQTMETAKAAKQVQTDLGKNVNGSCTTKVTDTTNGKSGVGHSGRIQAEMRAQNFQENGFPSKTAARRANTYGTPSHLQETFPDVKPVEGSNISQNCCAEHQSFDNYNKSNPGYRIENTRTSTVQHQKGGGFSTKPRCDNCSAYGSNMGDVVTDHVPDGTPVPPETYVAAGSTIGAITVASGGAILQTRKGKRVDSKCHARR